MTNKSLIAGLASVAAMAAVVWSMPAAAGMGSAAISSVRFAHDKWPGVREAADSCNDDSGHNDGDHDCDDPGSPTPRVGTPEPGTLALLALGLGGIGFGRRRREPRTWKEISG